MYTKYISKEDINKINTYEKSGININGSKSDNLETRNTSNKDFNNLSMNQGDPGPNIYDNLNTSNNTINNNNNTNNNIINNNNISEENKKEKEKSNIDIVNNKNIYILKASTDINDAITC